MLGQVRLGQRWLGQVMLALVNLIRLGWVRFRLGQVSGQVRLGQSWLGWAKLGAGRSCQVKLDVIRQGQVRLGRSGQVMSGEIRSIMVILLRFTKKVIILGFFFYIYYRVLQGFYRVVAYRVVAYRVCRLIGSVAYRVCRLIESVAYRVCRLIGSVAYRVGRLIGFVAYRVSVATHYRVCRSIAILGNPRAILYLLYKKNRRNFYNSAILQNNMYNQFKQGCAGRQEPFVTGRTMSICHYFQEIGQFLYFTIFFTYEKPKSAVSYLSIALQFLMLFLMVPFVCKFSLAIGLKLARTKFLSAFNAVFLLFLCKTLTYTLLFQG